MYLIAVTLLIPLAGGLLLPLLRFKNRTARAVYVEAVTLATSVLAAILCFDPPQGDFKLLQLTDSFALTLRVDGLSLVFTGLIAFLWPLATLYAFEYMAHENRENAFFAWYTLSYAATLGISMAANLFTLYVFYECLTLSTLPLVTHKRDVKSIRAGRQYLLYSLSGAALAFLGMMVLVSHGAGVDFTLGGSLRITDGLDYTLMRVMFVIAFIGFSVKAAMFPLYAWLPAASVAPTPVTALLHAVAVVNAGAYACMRLIYYSCGTDWLFSTWAQAVPLCLAAFTVVFGSAMAVREQHFKRRLAYSTVSNLSYILLGAALMTPAGMTGAMTHMISHGLMKITLFYCAGAVLVKTGQEYVQDIRGMGRVMPFTFAAFTVCAMALVGVPPLSGFLSKWNLLTAAAGTGLAWGAVAIAALIISAILTAIYMMSIVISAYFLPVNDELNELSAEKRDPSWLMKLPLLVISCAVVLMGLNGAAVTQWLSDIAAGLV
ncbi:MAG: proton-conducting membrane transporter [Clostridia bacterium]|nr:proton-conducting membrane transporter [Clostridia bacterium]